MAFGADRQQVMARFVSTSYLLREIAHSCWPLQSLLERVHSEVDQLCQEGKVLLILRNKKKTKSRSEGE